MSRFLVLQFIVLLVKGVLPLATFFVLQGVASTELLAAFLIVVSLANFLSNLGNLSANLMAPGYFFKGEESVGREPELAELFQSVRLLFSLLLASLGVFFVIVWLTPSLVPVIFYQVVLGVLPTWRFYSMRRVDLVLGVETLCRLPVYFCLVYCYISANYISLMYVYSAVAVVFVVYSALMLNYGLLCKLLKRREDLTKVLRYLWFVLPYNLFVTAFNSGLVFLIGLVGSSELIVQAGLMDRLKNILVQVQGVFMVERLASNRAYVVSGGREILGALTRNTLLVIVSILMVAFVLLLLYFVPTLFQSYLGYDSNFFWVFLLGFGVIPLISVTGIFVSQVLPAMRALDSLYLVALASGGACFVYVFIGIWFGGGAMVMGVPLLYEMFTLGFVYLALRKLGWH